MPVGAGHSGAYNPDFSLDINFLLVLEPFESPRGG
jgi:hypothetical protein